MDVQFTPEVEKQVNDFAALSGCGVTDVLLDALAGYFDEVVQIRELVEGRYQDLEAGRAQLIDGEEAFRLLLAKTEERRKQLA